MFNSNYKKLIYNLYRHINSLQEISAYGDDSLKNKIYLSQVISYIDFYDGVKEVESEISLIKNFIYQVFSGRILCEAKELKIAIVDKLYDGELINENVKKEFGIFSMLQIFIKYVPASASGIYGMFMNLTIEEADKFGLSEEFSKFDKLIKEKSFAEIKVLICDVIDLMLKKKIIYINNESCEDKYYLTSNK